MATRRLKNPQAMVISNHDSRISLATDLEAVAVGVMDPMQMLTTVQQQILKQAALTAPLLRKHRQRHHHRLLAMHRARLL